MASNIQEQVLIDRLAVDERGLKKCMSRYITCINKFNETKNTEPNEKDFDSLNNEIKTVSADLLALSQSFTKNRVTSDQRNSEIQYYQNLTDNYDREIESITAEIMQLQKDLEIEKKETAKQREYDSIASNINSYDSRDMSHREIKELKEQIEKLEAEEKIHGRAMDHLRSLFSTKISTQLHHFKDLLEKAQVQDYSAFGLELELKSNSETLPIESAKVISGDEKKEEKLEIGNGVHDTSASETITQPDHKLTTSASALVHPQTPSLIHEQDTNVRNDGEMDVDSAHPQMNESATHMDVEKMDAADESTSFAVNDEEVYNCSDGEIIDE